MLFSHLAITGNIHIHNITLHFFTRKRCEAGGVNPGRRVSGVRLSERAGDGLGGAGSTVSLVAWWSWLVEVSWRGSRCRQGVRCTGAGTSTAGRCRPATAVLIQVTEHFRTADRRRVRVSLRRRLICHASNLHQLNSSHIPTVEMFGIKRRFQRCKV